jgi:hypothetical protein
VSQPSSSVPAAPPPNPPLEEVITLISDAIKEGCTLPIDDSVVDIVPTMFRQRFIARLAIPGSWAREGANVLNASRQLGAISAAIARLHREPRVPVFVIRDAAKIVQKHCEIGFESGVWCE